MSANFGRAGEVMFIATLIAKGRLDESIRSEAAYQFDQDCTAGRLISADWIDEGHAFDLVFDASDSFKPNDSAELAEGIRDRTVSMAKGGMGFDLLLDVIVQPANNRQKKLLVADMDSTIIGQECIDELADYAGFKPQVAEITERAMQGELDFAAALRERVALLEGLEESVIGQCLAERIRPNPGAGTLVRTMQSKGAETILVSGGFTSFVGPIAEQVGFDRFEANVLAVVDGKLTGATEGRVIDAGVKRDVLIEARDRLGLGPQGTLAIGDGANDRLMIEEAGLGIAYRAKPALAEVAAARLDHNDLSALLWVQGIPRSEWVAD